jgi:hypothetical protein
VVAYRSKIRIQRVKGPLRRAYLPQEEKPTLFGVHPEIAKYSGVDPAAHESRATTLNNPAQH